MLQIISKEAIDKSDLNVENVKAYAAVGGIGRASCRERV